MIDPGRDTGPVPAEIDARDAGSDMSWQLATSLIAAWRSAGGDRPSLPRGRPGRAEQGEEAVAEQAVAGLAGVAGMFVQLCAAGRGGSPDDVLQDAVSLGPVPQPL